MKQRISTVLLIPEAHCAPLRQYLEGHGWGQGNLCVQLVHSDGSPWCGGHLHLGPDWAALLHAPTPIEGDTTDYASALAALVIYQGERDDNGQRVSVGPAQMFEQALALNGLSKVDVAVA